MSRGIAEFQPDRLVQVLAARRLTQTQLATMVGVSPATISKWRSGQQAPESEALERLATVVNVTPEWFTRPLLPSMSKPLFRSNASAHVAARAMLETRIHWANELVTKLTEFVDLPELKLPHRSFTNIDEIGDTDIEDAANECRALWNLGTKEIPDLALAAESNGIIVVREETGIAQIEGLSAWSETLGVPFVLLSSDKGNAFRSRFDLAHEIGHLILHRYVGNELEAERYKLKESQAHKFAGALLLPAKAFAEEIRTPVTLDSLLLTKQRYGISVAASIMRLYALNIISEEEKQNLYKRLSARWGVKSEPGDDYREPEKPRLLKRTIELLASSGIISVERLAAFSGLSAIDVEMIVGLSEGYLTSKKAAVVHLAKLKSMLAERREDQVNEPKGVLVQFTRSPKRSNS
ncbi:transcriptional repressor DicA [Yersinia ruckeri]|uniref:helix-turn-helix domain-containing protein n=1 Tax=Enterobacterales TaxID=91347 RepID=UPI0005DF190B|nr:XRE family transcriptional regulator [Yersinia ruckeri]EKN4198843.1 ImmA/IrrE family metallo-endopeptidase [Yersinia ruckeri]EKN4204255.1 ImmA/IrrE family metallo-endopeptidase [Yersinia ruckeri]EKN4702817.1 ImmA/IrrE family metallo-endopeptidase [Yersinia ruckeri]CNB45155.1 transcriptional repressor DicA [Yersinia ruckeri]